MAPPIRPFAGDNWSANRPSSLLVSVRFSPFHVCEFRCHFSIAHREDVHAAKMPGLSVPNFTIHPANLERDSHTLAPRQLGNEAA
jgi:hypothetical protein